MADNSSSLRPHQYRPGQSGNKAGRPPGSFTTDSAAVLEKARRAALRLVIERAKAGSLEACAILLNHNPAAKQ